MLDRWPDRRATAYDDDFEDVPASGWLAQYGGGIVLPLALIGYGIACLVTGHGAFGGADGRLDLYGPNAVALATAVLCLGGFLHCHYFWGNLYHLAALAVLGKIIAAAGFIVALVFLIVRVGFFGR